MNKRLTTDMADASALQIAIRPTRFFNMKKMAADFCSAQCIMDNTGSLIMPLLSKLVHNFLSIIQDHNVPITVCFNIHGPLSVNQLLSPVFQNDM